jgi:3-deoxy-7-phosphoheptulonate synthase
MKQQTKFILGHCSFENYESERIVCNFLRDTHQEYYRAMLWKPRTNPTSWQGIGDEGIIHLRHLKSEFPELKFVTEILCQNNFDVISDVVDVFQIGSRNSQNYELMKYLGSMENITILYKRGFGMTIDEWIDGLEYLNPEKNKIIMCARGIRSFDKHFRFMPDFDALIVLNDYFKNIDNVYSCFDPSHSAGNTKYVVPLMKAALAIETDFLEVEIHQDPQKALTDNRQLITFDEIKSFL